MRFAQNTDTLLVVWCTVELRHRTTGGYILLRVCTVPGPNCREEYVVGGSELATTTQNMVQQRTTVPSALCQECPKLSKIVQNCLKLSNMSKTVHNRLVYVLRYDILGRYDGKITQVLGVKIYYGF